MSDPARELRRNLGVVAASFLALWVFLFAQLPPLDHARFEVVNRSGRTIDALLISDRMPAGFRATPARVTQLAVGASATITTVNGDTGDPCLELLVGGARRTYSGLGMSQHGEFRIAILDGGAAIDFASRNGEPERRRPDALASAAPSSSR